MAAKWKVDPLGCKVSKAADAGAGGATIHVLGDEQPSIDELGWKLQKVHTDMDFMKSSLTSEMSHVCHELHDAKVTVSGHEAELAQLWRTSRQSESELKELNRLVDKVGCRLQDLLGEARSDTVRLQENLTRGLEDSRSQLESRVQELRGLVCSLDLEASKSAKQVMQQSQAWQAGADKQLASMNEGVARALAEVGRCSETTEKGLQKMRDDMQESERRLEASQKGVQDSLHEEAQALAAKQARCASELHRLVRGVTEQVDTTRERQDTAEQHLSTLRMEHTQHREASAEALQVGLAQTAQEASRNLTEMQKHVNSELIGIDKRLRKTAEECAAWPGALASAEARFAAMDAATRERLEAEAASCRSWCSGFVTAEVDKLNSQLAVFRSEMASLGSRLTTEEERSASLASALSAAEGRLSSEDAATREQVSVVANALTMAENRLSGEDALLSERLKALSDLLVSTENHLHAEDTITREQVDTTVAEVARNHRDLCKRLEALAGSLAGAESRLAGEDVAMRERLEVISNSLTATDRRLEDEGAETRKQVDKVAANLSTCEGRFNSEHATLRERLDGVMANLTGAEQRLKREDAALRERLEAVGSQLATVEGHVSSSEAALQQRLEAVAAEQSLSENRWSREHMAARKQLESLAATLSSAESRLASEDSFLRARLEALSSAFEGAESRRVGEEASLRERLEALSNSMSSIESRLGRECAVTSARLELLSNALSNAEHRLGNESATVRKQIEAFGGSIAKLESTSGSELTTLHERMEALSSTLTGAESRLAAEDTAIRERIEERVKEEVSWMLSLVKPIQQSIDKLAWGFHDLGCSHVRCAREFDVLEQVIRDVEVRVLPWRSGLDRDNLRMVRLAQPGPAGNSVASIMDSSGGFKLPLGDASGGYSPARPRGPRRQASARPAAGLAKRLVAEYNEQQQPSAGMMENPPPMLENHPAGAGASAARTIYSQPPYS